MDQEKVMKTAELIEKDDAKDGDEEEEEKEEEIEEEEDQEEDQVEEDEDEAEEGADQKEASGNAMVEEKNTTENEELLMPSFPIKPFSKLVSRLNGGHLVVTTEYRETMNRCMQAFILYLSHTSKCVAKDAGRSIVKAGDVTKALAEIGWEELIQQINIPQPQALSKRDIKGKRIEPQA